MFMPDNLPPAQVQLVTGQDLLDQRCEDGFVHRREPHQACVQPLQLCLRHGVEIHARSGLGRAHPLQPPKENLRCTRIGDGALPQATLDLRVTRRITATFALRGHGPLLIWRPRRSLAA